MQDGCQAAAEAERSTGDDGNVAALGGAVGSGGNELEQGFGPGIGRSSLRIGPGKGLKASGTPGNLYSFPSISWIAATNSLRRSRFD